MTVDSLPPRIGRYEVVERLGRGGMGVVYRAIDSQIGRTVAVKVLHSLDSDLRQRFVREIRFLGTLTHPNVVAVHDCGEQDGQPFIVMEFVDGATIAKHVRDRTLGVRQVVDLIREVCVALEYAHGRGIIHRDIKPANLMVDAAGVVKVLDFGVARSSIGTITASGLMVGTLNYMAPEQIDGAAVDERADVFAVGLVLYELLCGRQAFAGDTAGRIMHAVLHDDPPPLRLLMPGLPEDLERIVATAIRKRPEDRYQTMGRFLADLTSASTSVVGATPALATAEDVTVAVSAVPSPVAKVAPAIPAQPAADKRRQALWTGGSWSTSDPQRYLMRVAGVTGAVVLFVGAALLTLVRYREAPSVSPPAPESSIVAGPSPASGAADGQKPAPPPRAASTPASGDAGMSKQKRVPQSKEQEIAALLASAKTTSSTSDALAILQRASTLNPSRDDVRKELLRVRALQTAVESAAGTNPSPPPPAVALPPPPPAPPSLPPAQPAPKPVLLPPVEDHDTIAKGVLQRYEASYEARDVDGLVRVAPVLASQRQDLMSVFSTMDSVALDIADIVLSTPPDAPTGTIVVRCVLTYRWQPRVGKQPPDEVRRAEFSLQKADTAWVIARITFIK